MHPREVRTRDDLVVFVKALQDEYSRIGNKWENGRLEDYLEALSAWIRDSDHYADVQGIEISGGSWRYMAEMLRAATMYE